MIRIGRRTGRRVGRVFSRCRAHQPAATFITSTWSPPRVRYSAANALFFVLSPAEHNGKGLVIVLPISQGHTLARSAGYASTLMGAGLNTQGVVICDQPRTIDFAVRGARYVESVPAHVVDDVMSRIAPLVRMMSNPPLSAYVGLKTFPLCGIIRSPDERMTACPLLSPTNRATASCA